MRASNQLDKYRYYISKRFEIFLHGLNGSQLEGRRLGPKIILNSLPKSGTHLLESLFFEIPLMRHCGKKTLRLETQNQIKPKLKVISSLKKGQFMLSHMQYHDAILETTSNNNIKLIHLIRDPRDVLLSHLNYIERMDITQKSHKYIMQFDQRIDRLKAMINGKQNIIEPFPVVLNKFKPWINKEEVLCLRFEDLIGSNGGGNNQNQIEAVKSICEFISIKVEDAVIEKISKGIYSSKSSTFNKGKINNWKQNLNNKEIQWLNSVINQQITDYDYQ